MTIPRRSPHGPSMETASAELKLADLSVPRREIGGQRPQCGRARRSADRGTERPLPAVTTCSRSRFSIVVVVTVIVGPRSQAVEPIRLAQFLRGDPLTVEPYEIFVATPIYSSATAVRLDWRKEGRMLMSERSLRFPEGFKNLPIERSPRRNRGFVVRGALLVVITAALAALFVLLGEAIQGRVTIDLRPLWRSLKGNPTAPDSRFALALFFFMPTLGLGTWSVGRFGGGGAGDRRPGHYSDAADAGGVELNFAIMGARSERRLDELADQLDADLLLYKDGKLLHSSARVLAELGLVEPYLHPRCSSNSSSEVGWSVRRSPTATSADGKPGWGTAR